MITTDTVQKTLSDYEQLPEGSSYELIAGGLIQEPAPVPYHQLIALELSFAILTYIKRRNNNPGRLYIAPVDVVLSGYDVVQPDLVFIASGSVAVVGSKRIEGPPDLVVEILSPSNASLRPDRRPGVLDRRSGAPPGRGIRKQGGDVRPILGCRRERESFLERPERI